MSTPLAPPQLEVTESGSVSVEVPAAALPAVLAVVEAVRASDSSPSADAFAGRLALTVPEAAQALGLSIGTVRSLIRRGDLSSIAFGRAQRIAVRELTEYVDRRSDEAAVWAKPTPLRRRG